MRYEKRVPLRVVVDTNVWVSGLVNPEDPPRGVLRAALDQRFEPISSWELAEELADVLTRLKLRRYELAADDLRDLLLLLSGSLPSVEIEVAVRDPDDTPVVAAAVASNADTIVTGDGDLLEDTTLRGWLAERGIDVLTPTELVADLGLE